jgi:hypothetical protein
VGSSSERTQFPEIGERLVIIMNRFWLRIFGCVVLLLAVVIGGYVLWPAGSGPAAESKDVDQPLRQNQVTLRTPTQTAEPDSKPGLRSSSVKSPAVAEHRRRTQSARRAGSRLSAGRYAAARSHRQRLARNRLRSNRAKPPKPLGRLSRG